MATSHTHTHHNAAVFAGATLTSAGTVYAGASRYSFASFSALVASLASGSSVAIIIEETVDGTNYFTTGTFAPIAANGSALIQGYRLSGVKARATVTVSGGAAPGATVTVKGVYRTA
ncbi:MAG: hypothetical protein WCS84_08905 [Nocardioides sp.]|jgi:hypothetical protein